MPYKRIYDTIEHIEPLTKGWSEDKKYCVTTTDGRKYLLRITPISRYEARKSLFDMLERVAVLGIPMCIPVEFGICDDGVYSIQSWIDGEDLADVMPRLSDTEKYALGVKAGEILRKMHTIYVPDVKSERPEWGGYFDHTIDERIQKYHECGLRFENDENVLAYLKQNRNLIENRPRCFQHGDFFISNMMLEKGELKIIDFERLYFGDPWEDFIFVMLSAPENPHFTTGQFHGYFNGEPPLEFFKTYAFYIYSSFLPGIYESVSEGIDEINTMLKQTQDILKWFEDIQNPVPKWYLKDFHVQWIDGIPYRTSEPFDFSFLQGYGKVFKVFDNQDSGCICFGVSDGKNKYFIKFAGVKTMRHHQRSHIPDAIDRLKAAVPKYIEMAHPLLIRFIEAKAIGGGYMSVFDWFDGESFSVEIPGLHDKYLALPTDKKISIYERILQFHEYAAGCGYVAVDFNDYSVLYNFDTDELRICDIDFYAKQPYINGLGPSLGDQMLMAPEEFRIAGVLDEITNVYRMGATAFMLFSNYDRLPEAWTLSSELYAVIKKAVSDVKANRQRSIKQLIDEWRAAIIKGYYPREDVF